MWNLPKLTHCWLDIIIENRHNLITPSIICLSLICVSIKSLFLSLNQLINLFDLTPLVNPFRPAIPEDS